MHSNSKTQQVIATSSAEAELYAISSTIADAIHLKQLITEIENNIGVSTFDFDKHHCSFLLFFFCNKLGPTNGDQQKNKAYSTSLFVDSGFASSWATYSSSCFNREQPSRCFHQNTSSCSSSTSSRCWSSNRCCQRSGGIQQHLPCR